MSQRQPVMCGADDRVCINKPSRHMGLADDANHGSANQIRTFGFRYTRSRHEALSQLRARIARRERIAAVHLLARSLP
jgi:hypothetical protein